MIEELHLTTVTYTIDDDGIHLFCSCGTDIPCGRDPSPEELIAKQNEHRRKQLACPAHGAHPHDGMECLNCPVCFPPHHASEREAPHQARRGAAVLRDEAERHALITNDRVRELIAKAVKGHTVDTAPRGLVVLNRAHLTALGIKALYPELRVFGFRVALDDSITEVQFKLNGAE